MFIKIIALILIGAGLGALIALGPGASAAALLVVAGNEFWSGRITAGEREQGHA